MTYQTPDTVQNGDIHTVAISTKFNKITTSDTARWNANFDFFYKPHFYAPLKSNNIIVFFSNKINKINMTQQGGF